LHLKILPAFSHLRRGLDVEITRGRILLGAPTRHANDAPGLVISTRLARYYVSFPQQQTCRHTDVRPQRADFVAKVFLHSSSNFLLAVHATFM
jgi:hypothetical protein